MDNETVGQYLILERIGAGGMGEVFRARDTRLGRTVALKMLPPHLSDDGDRRARFMREARAAASLSHPSITILFEVGEADGRLFLAFEYVPGQTLRRVLAEGPMHPKRAIPLAIQVADALADAHGAGIIHRDIKPDNIIVTPKGSAKVLDFGLASWTTGGEVRETAATQVDTGSSQVLGTIAYMSPEQALAQPLDARTDVFSVGVVLYEMLTGRNPFAAPTPAATLINILQASPEPPSRVNKDVPDAVDAIVMRMLARDVQARYGSAAVVASDLRASYAERTEHVFEDDLRAPSAASGRRWLPIAAAILVVGALGLGGYTQRSEVRQLWKRWFGTPPAPVIAVIPLDEIGQQETYFADGLTDDLVMRLGQTSGLRVLGRSSTRAYRGRQPADVAHQTGAAVVLTGTVQREGEELKINLELIDPQDGIQMWRQQFVNPAGSVLAAQAVIADEVARALRVQLVPTEFRERSLARTVSPEAYDVYTRGRDALTRRDLDGAVALFERAVRQDDGFAEAYAGLAEALYVRAATRNGIDDDDHVRVKQMAVRAAAIEPDLAAVEIAEGLAAGSYREALRHLSRAAALDPSSAEAFHQIADQLIHVDTPRAVRLYERARALDPRMFANYADLVMAKIVMGRFEEIAGEVDALGRAVPDSPRSGIMQAWAAAPSEGPRLIGAFQEAAARKQLPPAGFIALAQRQAAAQKPADALESVNAVLATTPELCEAKAIKAGLLLDLGRDGEARTLARSLAGTFPRCAVLRAAAIGDAAAAGAELQNVAADEGALRSWMQIHFGVTGESAFQLRLYPWSKVADAPDVRAAHQAIAIGFAHMRKIADEELKGLP
jgi:TolB-like protein